MAKLLYLCSFRNHSGIGGGLTLYGRLSCLKHPPVVQIDFIGLPLTQYYHFSDCAVLFICPIELKVLILQSKLLLFLLRTDLHCISILRALPLYVLRHSYN